MSFSPGDLRPPSTLAQNPFVGPRATVSPLPAPAPTAPAAPAAPPIYSPGDLRPPGTLAQNPFVGPRATVSPLPPSLSGAEPPAISPVPAPVSPSAVPADVPVAGPQGIPLENLPALGAGAALNGGLNAAGRLAAGQSVPEAIGGGLAAGAGSLGGAIAGAEIGGAVGGPIGAAIGGGLGGIVGGAAGSGLFDKLNDGLHKLFPGLPTPQTPIAPPLPPRVDVPKDKYPKGTNYVCALTNSGGAAGVGGIDIQGAYVIDEGGGYYGEGIIQANGSVYVSSHYYFGKEAPHMVIIPHPPGVPAGDPITAQPDPPQVPFPELPGGFLLPGSRPAGHPSGSPSAKPPPLPAPAPAPKPAPKPVPQGKPDTPKNPTMPGFPNGDPRQPPNPFSPPFLPVPVPVPAAGPMAPGASSTAATSTSPPGSGPPVEPPTGSPCSGCGAALAAQQQKISGKLDGLNALLGGANTGLNAEALSLLQKIDGKLGDKVDGGLSGLFKRFTKWLQLDRLLNILTFIVTVQNAYFLVESLKVVTLQMVSDGLAVFGLHDEDGNALNLNKIIDKTIEDLLGSIVGDKTLETMKAEWKALSRIYQAGANIISAFQNIAWSILNALEIIGSWNAQIGNALKKYGVVGKQAFNWFNPAPNFHNKLFTAVFNSLNIVSSLDFVAQSILSARQAIDQISKQSDEFQKDFQELENPKPKEHKPTAAAAAKATAASVSPAPTDEELRNVG